MVFNGNTQMQVHQNCTYVVHRWHALLYACVPVPFTEHSGMQVDDNKRAQTQ